MTLLSRLGIDPRTLQYVGMALTGSAAITFPYVALKSGLGFALVMVALSGVVATLVAIRANRQRRREILRRGYDE